MKRPLASLLWVACLVLPLSCGGGGGGGGGGSALPTVLQAVFTGANPSDNSPDAGEFLTLYFSGDVTLATSALLDDTDLTLSSGSLGSVAVLPVLLHARAVRITLGAGVSFVPGTDTIALSSAQDALFSSGSRLPASSAVKITRSDGEPPTISMLSVNGVPAELNGTGSAGGTIQLPRTGFTIDAAYSDSSSAVDSSKLVLSSTASVRVSGQTIAAGGNLVSYLTGTPGALSASLTVGTSVQFNDGAQTLSLTVTDTTGNVSQARNLPLIIKNATNALVPLENGNLWYLDLTRDLDTISSSGSATITISTSNTPNTVPDFLEELLILGLRSSTPIANVSGSRNSNDVTLDYLKSKVLEQLALLYPSISVSFTFNDPGSFGSQQIVSYESGTHSRMAIGSQAIGGQLGLALFDPHNKFHEDDTGLFSSLRLGVFPLTAIQATVNTLGSPFRLTYDAFIKGRGTPIGNQASDGTRLLNIEAGGSTVLDQRQADMQTALFRWARFIAVVTAHECAHSMGLVKDGAQPVGLYGGLAQFGGSAGHLDLSGTTIFPAGAQEVMTSAISFQKSYHTGTGFNALFLSYFRHLGIYDE